MARFFLALALVFLPLSVSAALTLDQQQETILQSVATLQTNFVASSGGKYTSLPPVSVGGGSYRVDEYETPCVAGRNPPVCYGYVVIFTDLSGTSWLDGQGIKTADFATELQLRQEQILVSESMVTSTPDV